MMDPVYASSLKGYATPEMLWRFLLDCAGPMAVRHARNEHFGLVNLDTVTVEGETFLPRPVEWDGTQEEEVWHLAAAALELATGAPMFPARAQKASTPIPALRQQELESFNELTGRCLSYDATARPSAQEMAAIADREWKKCRLARRPRRMAVRTETKILSDYDRHWPETFLLSVLFLICLSIPLRAQTYDPDDMMRHLIESADLLRKGGEQNWKKAENLLNSNRDMFTLMDELRCPEADCPLLPSRLACFGVNRLVNGIKDGDRVQTTGKDFKNGADQRFGYAVFEKGVKQGQTALYSLFGRKGRQVFLIIPYDPHQVYSAALQWDGRRYEGEKGKDGIIVLSLPEDAGLLPEDALVLELINGGDADAAFILINDKIGNR